MRLPLRRPLAAILSWLWPSLPAASTTKNDMYPDLQALWDSGDTYLAAKPLSAFLEVHFMLSSWPSLKVHRIAVSQPPGSALQCLMMQRV
jgi:hypothetical protein